VSAEVIQLKPKRKKLLVDANAKRYFCSSCDGDSFNVFTTGYIRCTTCGSVMDGLSVHREPKPA
jgi:ribosomal protein L37AE/L43A